MACPDANLIQALVGATLPAAERAPLLDHLAGCDECQSLVAALGSEPAAVDPMAATGASDTLPAGAERGAGLPVGSRLSRYVLREILGAGGMGVVYAADDPELDRRIAIKVLHSGAAADQARLVREAQAMARVTHPNVIAVHDVGQDQGRVFVAMELVEGGNLRRWLAARPRKVREIVDVFVAAGRGLAAAHAAGLVHRDFKPDNVLVGDDGRVRVTDFGLARTEGALGLVDPATTALASAASGVTTRTGAVLGTPAYMAPEQFAGGHVDARTDGFAFAIALYEALYGRRPFAEDTLANRQRAAERGELGEVPRGRAVPPGLHAIVVRGLAARPGERWPTMDALLAALSRDRTRVPRAIARAALTLLVAVAVGLGADQIARERARAAAGASFEASRGQLGRQLALRYDTFVALSEMSQVMPVMKEVAAVDEGDFGLAAPADEGHQLAERHGILASTDWGPWEVGRGRGSIAVADYKGRLLYTGAATERFGDDVRGLPAVARPYAGAGDGAMVVRGDDPRLIAAGVHGGRPLPGLFVVLGRATIVAGVPRIVFVQVIPGAGLLADLALGGDTHLALVAPDGSAEGDVPAALLDRAPVAGAPAVELDDGGAPWLVQRHAVRAIASQDEVASIVLARPVGGLALFGGARALLAGLAAGLLVTAALATALARRR